MSKSYKYLFIYKTTNLINGKIYVGQHQTNKIEDGYIGHGIYEQKHALGKSRFPIAVRKYKYENFKREIIEFCEDREQLNTREIFWIKELNAHYTLSGYNMAWGGYGSSGMTGKHHSEKTRERQSKARLGRKESEEVKQKHKNTLKNKPIQTCPWCGYQGKNNMKRWHGDNCKQNPNYTPKERSLNYTLRFDKRELQTCKYCGYQSKNNSVLTRYHGDNCKQNPNYIPREKKPDTRELLTCEHCGFRCVDEKTMKKWHLDNCKHKQEVT